METTGDLGYGIYSLTVVGMFLVATVIHICLWNKDHTFCVRCIIVTDFCLWKSIIISYQVRKSEKKTISILIIAATTSNLILKLLNAESEKGACAANLSYTRSFLSHCATSMK